MIKRILPIIILFSLVSCTPTSYLKLDILNPAQYTFSDTGKITFLNTAYLPSAMHVRQNLISVVPAKEKLILDTLIMTNLLNGFFSVLNESPVENLRNADYEEIRTNDTTNFLLPLASRSVSQICTLHKSRYLIALEYYGFNRRDSSSFSGECWDAWESTLEVSDQVLWRIYSSDGELLDQIADLDTMYWNSNACTDYKIPELTDAMRELFFHAGEKYAKRISPYWSIVSRSYFLIYHSGNDISLDRDQLQVLKSGKRNNLAFKACCNLAVLSESEDKQEEAIAWLKEAIAIKPSDFANAYINRIELRISSRELLDRQTGIH